MIRKYLIVTVSGLVLALACYGVFYARQSKRLDDANTAMQEGDLTTAITLLGRYLQDRPEDEVVKDTLWQIKTEFAHRFLKQAKAKLAGGENQAAIMAYHEHIAYYPDDYEAQLALIDVYKVLKIYALAEKQLNELAEKDDLSADVRRRVDHTLNEIINTWANETKRQADRDMAAENINAAIRQYTQAIQLRARNPALKSARGDRNIAIRAFDDVVSWRAYAVWLATDLQQAQSVLHTEFDKDIFQTAARYELNRAEQLRYRQGLLAQHIWSRADSLLAQHHWQLAYDTYEQAKHLHRLAIGEEFDAAIAAMQFNQVTAKLYLKLNHEAIRLYEAIRDKAPYYEPAKMRALEKALAFPARPPPLPEPYPP